MVMHSSPRFPVASNGTLRNAHEVRKLSELTEEADRGTPPVFEVVHGASCSFIYTWQPTGIILLDYYFRSAAMALSQ
jgi:hypothetical protein